MLVLICRCLNLVNDILSLTNAAGSLSNKDVAIDLEQRRHCLKPCLKDLGLLLLLTVIIQKVVPLGGLEAGHRQ